MGYADDLVSVIGGPGRPVRKRAQFPSPVEGRVNTVTPQGVKFTIPDFDGGKHVFGPAPYTLAAVDPAAGPDVHDHAGTAPPVGSRCLVVFVGLGIDRPWVLAWWPA